MNLARRLMLGLLLALLHGMAAAQGRTEMRVLDDFSDPSRWEVVTSDEVQASLQRVPRGGGLCLRYDFGSVSGHAALRRKLAIDWPEHYELRLKLRGRGAPNALQLKFVDESGDNVWWMNRPDYEPKADGVELRIRQRQVQFAWGPIEDRQLKRTAAIELVVASGRGGGAGELCFERLALTTLPEPKPLPPAIATASSSAGTALPARALDGDAASAWRSGTRGFQTWAVDFGAPRELNGLLLRWAEGARATDFDLQFSDDGRRWQTVKRVRGSQRDVLALWLPPGDNGHETRYIRLGLRRGALPHYALAEVQLMDPVQWPHPNAVLQTLAANAARGRYPRGFMGEQNYWTLLGVDGGGAHSALLSEDGAIEPARGGPSLEPFLIDEAGRVTSWADVQIEQSLRDGYLPVAGVKWTRPGFGLAIEAGADGNRNRAELIARYTVTNSGTQRRTLTLALALRPWQVNPPQQFLNTPGGVAPIWSLRWHAGQLQLDGRPWMQPVTKPDAVGAAAFETADALDLAAADALPPLSDLRDEQALASAVLRWKLDLAPGESRSVAVVLPLTGAPVPPLNADAKWAAERLDAVAAGWRDRLNHVSLQLPPSAQPLADTLRSSLAHILMSRDGPALRPGTRSYARSWIRDGAMMVAGLLRLGEIEASREFVQWYAGHLFANGKVPCCVDARGADPVPENDSHGEFIFSVAEFWRHTGDRAFVEKLWPQVDAAVRYMEQLRQSERTSVQRRTPLYGLMPASISHEGYSAKPMHSYWDNFWALAGYRDAQRLAEVLGHTQRAAELARQRDEFSIDLQASLVAAVVYHGIPFLPGAAELGDFDPSSSTMIFSPAGAENLVTRPLLRLTWDRAWQEFVARRDGQRGEWMAYTPYELRSVSAHLRLERPDRAHALLDYYLRDRRPAAWNGWAEVVGRLPREPRFVGDMPHAWISSDYIRSTLDLLAYERESDDALVLAAGVPEAWWRTQPVEVRGLGTAYGRLDYRLELESPQVLKLTLRPGLKMPPGGMWFAWSGESPPPVLNADGRPLKWEGKMLRLPEGAGELKFKVPGG